MEYCTGLQVEDVHIEDLVDLFITVQWHRAMELDSDAKEVLAKFQADILVYRKCQTNMVVNYYKEVGFEYESDGESEADLGKEDEDTLDTGSASDRLEKDNCVQNNPSKYQISYALLSQHSNKQNLEKIYRTSWQLRSHQGLQYCGLISFAIHQKSGQVYVNIGWNH